MLNCHFVKWKFSTFQLQGDDLVHEPDPESLAFTTTWEEGGGANSHYSHGLFFEIAKHARHFLKKIVIHLLFESVG